jgi:hypothetical protein
MEPADDNSYNVANKRKYETFPTWHADFSQVVPVKHHLFQKIFFSQFSSGWPRNVLYIDRDRVTVLVKQSVFPKPERFAGWAIAGAYPALKLVLEGLNPRPRCEPGLSQAMPESLRKYRSITNAEGTHLTSAIRELTIRIPGDRKFPRILELFSEHGFLFDAVEE